MENLSILGRLEALYPQAKKSTLREMVQARRVLVNGAIVRSLKQPLAEGDKLEVLEKEAGGQKATVLAGGLRVIFFDSELIVVEKPSGMLTSTDPKEKRPTVWATLKEYFRKQNSKNQVHLIHRLDRDASGLLVFARTWDAYGKLKQQFFEHTITREYDVVVHGNPKAAKGRLENLLIEDEQTGDVLVTEDLRKGKLAICEYEVVERNKARRVSHVRCRLYTGKKHQIRVQLKAAGHVVCGDARYGTGEEAPGRLALHASRLALAHPRTGRVVEFVSVMPGGMRGMFG